MKLNEAFLPYDTGSEFLVVPVGSSGHNAMLRGNATAAAIIGLLKEPTDRDSIVRALCDRFDAPPERIAQDVDKCLELLRSIGALDE